MIEREQRAQKVFLAGVHIKDHPLEESEASFEELHALAITLGLEIVGSSIQNRPAYDSRSFLGKGKILELKEELEELKVDMLIIDGELSPKQAKVIEGELGIMVIDRSQLILEIFSDHARTPESKAQVELARLHYMLPRLVGMWAHLDREKGGIGASRGMGEKQVNIDRNITRRRMSKLEKDLAKVEGQRATQAKQRKQHFTISLVGYTNAGKTTVLKSLTNRGDGGQDQLFATLESTTRKLFGLTKPEILLSDTVGFIQKLPHHLIASFRSTLSVVREADLLLHVVDGHSKMLNQQIKTTEAALKEIGAEKIPRLMIINKMDLVSDPVEEIILKKSFPNALLISNLIPDTIDLLREAIQKYFVDGLDEETLRVPYGKSRLIPRIYQQAMVEEIEYTEDAILITITATAQNLGMIKKAIALEQGDET